MFQRWTEILLRWLRVPPQPQPPHGDPASLRVFRAGQNYYRLRLFRWSLTQVLALAGIIFWVAVFLQVESDIRTRHLAEQARIDPRKSRNVEEYLRKIGAVDEGRSETQAAQPAAPDQKAKPHRRVRFIGWSGFKIMLVQLALWLPPWALPLIWFLKIGGIVVYLAQLPFTYLLVRLDYDMRWYMVTDRSLRIRFGVWKVNESTMSFANIQQVEVSQGPLQRLLGLSDVHVQSAGGAGADLERKAGREEDMHLGLFHSVTNATEIRDLILERLRRFRQAGLGDPDDHRDHLAPAPTAAPSSPLGAESDAIAAAQEVLAEARALRASLL